MTNLFSKLLTKRPTAKVAESDFAPSTVTSAGAIVGARTMVSPAWSKQYTPSRVASILEAAERGDESALAEYWSLADKVVEREMHIAGTVSSLILGIAGLPHNASPQKTDKSKRGQKIADEVAEWLQVGSPLRLAATSILSQGITHGLGVAAVNWDTSGAVWTPVSFVHKPAHFFTFDRSDACTPLRRADPAGQPATPIAPGTALVFAPKRNSPLQIKNGLAWILCWSWVIKSIVLAYQTEYIENNGQPVVVGKFEGNMTEQDKAAFHRAISALKSGFRGIFNKSMDIEVHDIGRSGTDIYEKLCRYLDEGVSKVVLSSTLTTDSGGNGSYSLGKVHADSKYDVIRAYAQQWAASLQQLAAVYVAWNYGPDAPVPRITVDVEEAEDMVAGSQIVKNLSDAGVELAQDEIRERFGFRKPQDGEATIGAPAQQQSPAAPTAAKNALSAIDLGRGCPEHSFNAKGAPIRDAIDDLADAMLADWATETASIDLALHAAVAGAGDIEEMRAALLEAVNKIDTTQLTAMFTKARTATRVAGDSGADL